MAKMIKEVTRLERKRKQVIWDTAHTESDTLCQLPYTDDEESQSRQQRKGLL
jgi:hypothetical protein